MEYTSDNETDSKYYGNVRFWNLSDFLISFILWFSSCYLNSHRNMVLGGVHPLHWEKNNSVAICNVIHVSFQKLDSVLPWKAIAPHYLHENSSLKLPRSHYTAKSRLIQIPSY